MRRVRRHVVAWSTAAFLALWGIVYVTVRGDDSLASTPDATTTTSSRAGSEPSASGGALTPPASTGGARSELPPASTRQS